MILVAMYLVIAGVVLLTVNQYDEMSKKSNSLLDEVVMSLAWPIWIPLMLGIFLVAFLNGNE